MQTNNIENFSEFENVQLRYRRELLPWWVRAFSWIFIVMGALAVPGFVALFFTQNFESSLFDLDQAIPGYGKQISALLFIISGFAGLCLWLEKKQAVIIAIICGFINLIVCSISMVLLIVNGDGNLRLEFFICIFFLIKMFQIKNNWERNFISRKELY
nr:hypothetical protein [uncultured Flavobacterium sp.]